METVLQTLAHPLRLRTIQILLQEGPLRQEQIRERLEAQKGHMSGQIRELFRSGLVERNSPRGPIRVVLRDETLDLLQNAADLEEALAARKAALASEEAARLRGLPRDDDTQAKG